MTKNDAELVVKKNEEIGLKALMIFHKYNSVYTNYKIKFDELVKLLSARPNQKRFLSIFGGAIESVSQTDIDKAMKNLASSSRGQIPSNNAMFRQAVIDKTTQGNFIDAISFVATESAKTVANGMTEVGETVFAWARISKILVPIAVVYFVYLWINNKARA